MVLEIRDLGFSFLQKIGFQESLNSQLTVFNLYIVHHLQSKTHSLSQISNTFIPSILLINKRKERKKPFDLLPI